MAAENQFSVQEILNRVFDPDAGTLVTTGTGPGGASTERSAQEILNIVFDPDTNTIAIT
jgi:hypothetical protein